MEVAASVAGLITLADLTFRVLYKYVRGVKEAENDIKNLKREIEGLCNVFRILHALTDVLVTEEEKNKAALSVCILDQCKETLEEISTKVQGALSSFEQKKLLKATLQKLKWPFSDKDTKELLSTLSRYKLTISMATSADSLSKLHILLNQQVQHKVKIEEVVKNIDEKTKLIANIQLDKEKQRILDSFMKPTLNPRHNLDQSIALRHPTTGAWLMSSVELLNWFTDSGSLLWLNGIAGGGKTILAGLIIQEAMSRSSDEVGIAFFFCDYKNAESLRATKILGAIAAQLALQNDAAFEILEKYHEDLNPPDALAATPDVNGLGSTIASLIKTFRHVLIVVDGLDECGDEMGNVTTSLAAFASVDTPASVALFSRQEPHIRARMGHRFTEIQIEAHTEDIEIYVRAELESRIQSQRLRLSDPETANKIEAELIRRAHGMFRWVACQLDSLGDLFTDRDRLDALRQLPRTLHESYRRLLERINTKPARTQKRVQLCLHFIAFFPKKLSITELCQAVSTPESIGDNLNRSNTVVENDIIHYCSSLIRKSADGNAFEFAHFSVQEFLESDMIGLEKYRISRQESLPLLALQCLRFVQLGNIDVWPDDRKEFVKRQQELGTELPFYQQASAYWPALTRACTENSQQPLLYEAVESLFRDAYSPKLKSWFYWFMITLSQAVSEIVSSNTDWSCLFTDNAFPAKIALDDKIKPLHLASALNMPNLCVRLMEDGASATISCRSGSPLYLAATSLLEVFEPILNMIPVESEFFSLLLPTVKQRSSTMKCLTKEASFSDFSINSSLFSTTLILSCHLQDFTPLIELISSGRTPTTDDIELFGSYLSRCWSHYGNHLNDEKCSQNKMSTNFDISIRALNRYLRDTSAFEHKWGFEFGKVIWTKAVAMELSFTRDPSLTHREISVSSETLRERIMLAISNDSHDVLSNHLEDRRVSVFDSWSWNESQTQTLLHHATAFNALQCVDLLLSRGCDPYAVNNEGLTVLQSIDITKNGSIIDIFLAHHVSLLGTDEDQCGLWHLCAYFANSSADFMLKLFSANPQETQAAVLIKTVDGLTPLALALSNEHNSSSEFKDLEDNALSFIKHCNDVPGFWEKHDDILPQAFKFGSEKVMHRLFNLGMKPDPFIIGTATPLHGLSAYVSSAWVNFLMTTFPGAVESRYSGRLPVENYASACIEAGTSPDTEVFEMLVSSTILQSLDETLLTPWESFCFNTVSGRWGRDSKSFANSNSWEAVGLVLSNYIALGAVRAHDEVSWGCGTGKLLSTLLHSFEKEGDSSILHLLEPRMLNQAILSAKSWDPSNYDVVRFLKISAQVQDSNIAEVLLEHGVDVDQRVDGLSVIEFVCYDDFPTVLCSTETGRYIIELFLDYADRHELGRFSTERSGLGLLHRMASSGQEPHICWLMKELVRRGVDINGIDGGANTSCRWTPLSYHVATWSTCYAGYLLELGADPCFRPNYYDDDRDQIYFNAVLCSSYYNNVSFLRKLLEFSETTATEVRWASLITLELPCGREISTIECSSLHIACYYGYGEIVEFFVENKLLALDMTTEGGHIPLHLAALGGRPHIIDYLIAKGQEVDVMSTTRITPLHYAAANGHLEATKELLSKNAQGSISAFSWTPRIAALDAGHTSIVRLLGDTIGIYDGTKSELIRSHRHKQKLLKEMEMAIASHSVLDLSALSSNGCPLNDPIPQSNGSTPLYLALLIGHSQDVEELLHLGASTLTHCYPTSDYKRYRKSVIEHAALNSSLVSMFQRLIDQYVRQGGDLVDGPDSPIFFAAKGNVQGMRILLTHLRKHYKQWGDRHDYVNRKALEKRQSFSVFGEDDFDKVTALSVAVKYNQVEIAQLLLENGADVDSTSTSGVSPIQRSTSSEMTSLLMRFGASTVPVLTMSLMEVMHVWRFTTPQKANSFEHISIVEGKKQERKSKESWLGLDGFSQRFYNVVPDWRQLLALRHLQGPLRDHLRSDSKLGNYLVGFAIGHHFLLNTDFELENLEPFPWYQISADIFTRMAFLRRNFRFFQRRFTSLIFKQWLNMEPDRGWSPLCRAAARDIIDALENCLSIGANIDFEGCSWGSALMIASACGKLASVKILVRAGAKIDYIGSNGHTSALSVTKSEVVKRWLLVGQFVEQKKIVAAKESDTDCLQLQTRRRSGIAKMKVRLAELYRRRYEESSFDYLRRLERLKLELRGKVPYYTDGVIYEDSS